MVDIHNSTNESEYINQNKEIVDETSSTIDTYNDNNDQESFIFIKKPSEIQQPIVINKTQPLAKHNVLYLGTAIPSSNQYSINSIQEPLSKRYPTDGKEIVQGIETWLCITKNDLQIQFANDPSTILYYPILSLNYCASIRFATRTKTGDTFPNGWRFVALDSSTADYIANKQNPPIFCVIFKRTRFLPVDECHCFVAKTKRAALELVQACCDAYQTADLQHDLVKAPIYFKTDDKDESKLKEIENEIYTVPASKQEQTIDYQTNKQSSGFFYKTDKVSISPWEIWDHRRNNIQRPSSNRSNSSFTSYKSFHRLPPSTTPYPDRQQSILKSSSKSSIKSSKQIIEPQISQSNDISIENQVQNVVFIPEIYETPTVSQQVPSTEKLNYDFHIDFTNQDQFADELVDKIGQLVLSGRYFKNEPIKHDEKNKFKEKHKNHKHRHHHHHHQHNIYDQVYEDHRKGKHSTKTHKTHRHKYSSSNNSFAPMLKQQYSLGLFDTPYLLQKTPSRSRKKRSSYQSSFNNTIPPIWHY